MFVTLVVLSLIDVLILVVPGTWYLSKQEYEQPRYLYVRCSKTNVDLLHYIKVDISMRVMIHYTSIHACPSAFNTSSSNTWYIYPYIISSITWYIDPYIISLITCYIDPYIMSSITCYIHPYINHMLYRFIYHTISHNSPLSPVTARIDERP